LNNKKEITEGGDVNSPAEGEDLETVSDYGYNSLDGTESYLDDDNRSEISGNRAGVDD